MENLNIESVDNKKPEPIVDSGISAPADGKQ